MLRILVALCSICLTTASHAQVAEFLNGGSVGTRFPEHELKYVQGKDPAHPRLVIVDFWATWCAPCIEAIPHLNEIAGQFADARVAVVGVSREPETTVLRFLSKGQLKYTAALDVDGSLNRDLRIWALPFSFIVNSASKIIWRGLPESITDALLRELLANEQAAAASTLCAGPQCPNPSLNADAQRRALSAPMGAG
jgi:thiol-disulfide isomerase/thioredoxin